MPEIDPTDDALLARLEAGKIIHMDSQGWVMKDYNNPDGIEAAARIRALLAEVAILKGTRDE